MLGPAGAWSRSCPRTLYSLQSLPEALQKIVYHAIQYICDLLNWQLVNSMHAGSAVALFPHQCNVPVCLCSSVQPESPTVHLP
jgi:hypothetical protein